MTADRPRYLQRIGGTTATDYTSDPHRAIDENEAIPSTVQAAFSKAGRERDEQREHERRQALRKHAQRLADYALRLEQALRDTRAVEPSLRSLARRANHDLQHLADTL